MTEENGSGQVRFNVAPDLDYVHRDFINIYVGDADVLLEFGNEHRSMPGRASIGNRIVLTIPAAYDLQKRLEIALKEAQKLLQKNLMESNKLTKQ